MVADGIIGLVPRSLHPAEWNWDCLAARARAYKMMRLGEWEAAERHWWRVLDSSKLPHERKWALNHLAWLEVDTQRAARLLELACEDDDSGWLAFNLVHAVYLSHETGSDAFTRHYLERLRAVSRQRAYELKEELKQLEQQRELHKRRI